MNKMWIVQEDDDSYYFDVIGAATAEDAAKMYVARSKKTQIEDIEKGKELYAKLLAEGRISDPWEQSGFRVNVVLPQEVQVVPMRDADGYRDEDIAEDSKYEKQAFRNLFDWNKKVRVRL